MADRHNRRERHPQERHPRHGPRPGNVENAIAHVAEMDPTNTPDLGAMRVLREAFGDPPWAIADVRIRRVDVARGRPKHGALRSDDHISTYEVEFDRSCPADGCASTRAVYEYDTHHHIAGHESITCARCDHVFHEKDWS